MMQFIEKATMLTNKMTYQKIALFVIVLTNLVTASTQFDINVGAVSGEVTPESGVYAGGLTIKERYDGLYALSPKLQLMLESRFDGLKSLYWNKKDNEAMKNYPLQEKLLPSSNIASAGLRWTGLGDAQLTLRNILYLNSALITSPYYMDYFDTTYLKSNVISRKARSYANVYWSLPIGRAELTADLNFIIMKYLRVGLDYDTELSDYVYSDSSMYHNNDLWSSYAFSYKLFKEVYIKLGTTLKQNLSGHQFLNLYQYKIQLSGTHEFPQKNEVFWLAGAEQYQRSNLDNMSEYYIEAIKEFPIPTRLLFYVYLRDVLTISRGLFLKGTAIIESGNELLKQRYEISLRKAWKNRSYVEPGYCTSVGGLFPIQSAYVKSCIHMVESFGITPAIKFSWNTEEKITYKGNVSDTTMEISFLKTLATLELSYAIKKRLEILLGANYTYFNKDAAAGFPNRFCAYFGIQSIIP